MEAPNLSFIISRTLMLLAALVAILFGLSFYKKKHRQSEIATELKSITSDSSFFQQFYAEQAKQTLVRAVALIAEANKLGVAPEKSIDQSLGIVAPGAFDEKKEIEPSPREKIIRTCLRGNYENFLKLGYTPDVATLSIMKTGLLPPIPTGPEAGKQPVIATLIPTSISPGIEKVLANLEIRPPAAANQTLTDIQVASAKRLAVDLEEAKVIEEPVRDKIVKALTPAPPEAK